MNPNSESFLNLTEKRRSVRKYLPGSVPRESLDRCLTAAQNAPSANNGQPWEFIVAADDTVREQLVIAARFGPLRGNLFADQAPVIVAVNETPGHRPTRWGGKILGRDFPLMDIGMAVQNFCLQAAEENLGTCILGLFSARRVRKALNLPSSRKPRLLITVGKPANEEIPKKKRKPLSEISRYIEGRGISNGV